MEFKKYDKYTLLKPAQESVNEFLKTVASNYANFKDEHLIIDISEKINIELKELLLFLDLSEIHRKNGLSFVIVCERIEIDDIPDELNVAPTIEEAQDILEMDAIERDLGF